MMVRPLYSNSTLELGRAASLLYSASCSGFMVLRLNHFIFFYTQVISTSDFLFLCFLPCSLQLRQSNVTIRDSHGVGDLGFVIFTSVVIKLGTA